MTIQELGKTQEGAGQEAIGAIPSDDLNITAPGKLRIIKRNGKVVPFEEDKIKSSRYKSFSRKRIWKCSGKRKNT